MPFYIHEWRKLGLHFDGIMTGFLGSEQQIEIVEDFIQEFRTRQTIVLVDPVMGDNGKIYPTYTQELCRKMRKLIAYADIITPNLTEACILTETPYKENWRHNELSILVDKLMELGAKRLVITGIRMGNGFIGNAIGEVGKETTFQRQMVIEETRSGTGDVFAAVLAADQVNEVPFVTSVKRASRFVRQCLSETVYEEDSANNTGINFEETLWRLKTK